MLFYVYEWFIKETDEIIYVGKGCRNRYRVRKHNRLFNEMIARFDCDSRIIKYFDTEEEAFEFEYLRIEELKKIHQCVCNIKIGGSGGVTTWWDENRRSHFSKNNVMYAKAHRDRMSQNNPMKNPQTVEKVKSQLRRKVVINNTVFAGVSVAAESLKVSAQTITAWCKRGYDTEGNPCRYYNEEQKEYDPTKILKYSYSKRVIVDDIMYLSVKDAAKAINVWPETLIRAIKQGRQCKGHSCRYDNQQPSCGNFDNSTTEGSTTNG